MLLIKATVGLINERLTVQFFDSAEQRGLSAPGGLQFCRPQ